MAGIKRFATLSISCNDELPQADSTTKHRYFDALVVKLRRMLEAPATKDGSGNLESILVMDGSTSAIANNTITWSTHATANDTVTIGAITFTGKASPTLSTEFAIGSTATATATNLAAKVNAHPVAGAAVQMFSAAGVNTVYSNLYGAGGQIITLATTSAAATIGGSGLALESGGTTKFTKFSL